MDRYHYKHKNFLMTDSEHEFFIKLISILGDKYYIFPQIHLGTIVRPNVRWTYRWSLWRNAFFFSDKYSVDYVLCDQNGIKPKVAIELDDISHQREQRKYRDRVVEKILHESDVDIIRFTCKETENIETIRAKLNIFGIN